MKHAIALMLFTCGTVAGQAFDLHLSMPMRARQDAPLLIGTTILLQQEAPAKIGLKDGEPWTSALRLLLLDAEGNAVDLDWERPGASGAELEFGEDALEAGALFGVSSVQLPAGDYTLQAVLDTAGKSADGAWSGRVASRRVAFTVAAADADWLPGEALLDKRQRARWSALHGEFPAAIEMLNDALELSPGNLDVVLEKCDLLLETEQREEALALLRDALDRFRATYPKANHPPREILRRLAAAGV